MQTRPRPHGRERKHGSKRIETFASIFCHRGVLLLKANKQRVDYKKQQVVTWPYNKG